MEGNIESTQTPTVAVACPCCGGLSLELFEDTLDIEGKIIGVEICLVCSALVNRSSLERLAVTPQSLREVQTSELANVYPINSRIHATLEQEIGTHRETIDFFLAEAVPDRDPAKLVYAEIGIGRGTFIRSAAAVFQKCYAIDLAFDLFEATRDQLPVPDNIVLLESINHAPEPLDVVVAWHSLEHVPKLYELVAEIRAALRPGGHLFFQVPLYRPNHVVDSHYLFLNRRSVAILAELEEFELAGIWMDHHRACMTGLLRKPAALD